MPHSSLQMREGATFSSTPLVDKGMAAEDRVIVAAACAFSAASFLVCPITAVLYATFRVGFWAGFAFDDSFTRDSVRAFCFFVKRTYVKIICSANREAVSTGALKGLVVAIIFLFSMVIFIPI